MPPETVSVTKGMGNALCGGREGVALWVGGKGWKVDMLRAWVVARRVWAIEGRRARRVDLAMGSMVRVLCISVWLLMSGRLMGVWLCAT